MFQRKLSASDQWLGQLSDCLASIFTKTEHTISNPYPAQKEEDSILNKEETKQAIQMLRVDHSGEVCAQALYHAQALLTKDDELKTHLLHAKEEEKNHLEWCQSRLTELGGSPSLLNPIWAAGAYTIGLTASLAGDHWNLGFLAETETQVTQHLENQLKDLSERDYRTRAILDQMRQDEMQHGSDAYTKGGKPLPDFIKQGMRFTAKIMTFTAKYI